MSSGSGFIGVPLPSDAEDVLQESVDYVKSVFPDWEPNAGALDTHILEATARPAATANEAATEMTEAAFRRFGSLVGIGATNETHAVGLSTWTMKDNAGYTIPDGTQVTMTDSAGDEIAFEVEGDVIVPNGSTATSAGAVILVAIEPGAAGSGLTGSLRLVDPLEFVTSAVAVGTTTGGVDAEDTTVYMDRLSDELQLLSPAPILPPDFAILAKRVSGIHRALAVDTYNPADQTYDNERYVAIAAIDASGAAVGPSIKTDITTLLESMREQNFEVPVFDPTITAIDVQFTAKALPGYTAADVETAAEAAVAEYLSPVTWGIPPTGNERDWVEETVVREYELAEVINRVEGIHYLTALTFRKGADPYASTDVTITGPAALASAGTVAGTVTS